MQTDTEWDQESRRTNEVGFVAKHSVFTVLPWDKQLVGRLLEAVIRSGAMPRITLSFLVSDDEGMMQGVLAAAVANAKARAEIIAASAGVKLGMIQRIDHGYSELRFSSDDYDLGEAMVRKSMAGPELNPDQVEASDTVTVTWLIQQ